MIESYNLVYFCFGELQKNDAIIIYKNYGLQNGEPSLYKIFIVCVCLCLCAFNVNSSPVFGDKIVIMAEKYKRCSRAYLHEPQEIFSCSYEDGFKINNCETALKAHYSIKTSMA